MNPTRWMGTAALAAAVGLWLQPAASAGAGSWSRAEAETFLRSAAVVGIDKDAESGRTLPWIVRLEAAGVRCRAVFKPIHRPRPRIEAASYRYELAAYELAGLFDLDFIPPEVEREIDGLNGALQLFVEDCLSERDRERTDLRPPDAEDFRRRLDEIRVFEILAGGTCADKDDILLDTSTWKVWRVDFAEAFPVDPALSVECPFDRCPRGFYDRLLRTPRAAVERRIKAYLSDSEINALCERKKRIVARLQDLIREKGERAVLF